MNEDSATLDQAPLLSPGFVWKLTGAVACLCVLTLAISLAGRMFGQTMILVGHTSDTTMLEIVIGNDVMALPANVIRFESERVSGVQQAIDTYFTWPGMQGYSEETRDVFNRADGSGELLFARVTQATMSADMSGRLESIYRRLVEGAAVAGPAGLVSYRMRKDAGYANELLYVDEAGGLRPYVVRCLIEGPEVAGFNTRTGCQRDIRIGDELSLTYRFSINLLPHWRAIEDGIRTRFQSALAAADRSFQEQRPN